MGCVATQTPVRGTVTSGEFLAGRMRKACWQYDWRCGRRGPGGQRFAGAGKEIEMLGRFLKYLFSSQVWKSSPAELKRTPNWKPDRVKKHERYICKTSSSVIYLPIEHHMWGSPQRQQITHKIALGKYMQETFKTVLYDKKSFERIPKSTNKSLKNCRGRLGSLRMSC